MHVKQLIELLSKLEPTAKVDIVIDGAYFGAEIIADIVLVEEETEAADTVDNTGLVFMRCKVNEEWTFLE